MTFARPKTKLPMIALAAILGSLAFAAEGASACDMGKAGSCATATSCGCCKVPDRPSAAPDVPDATMAARTAPIRGVPACASSPSGACVCAGERSEAPEPRPTRTTSEDRPASARELASSATDLLPSLTPPSLRYPPTAGPPPRTALYLRTSRLLI